MRTLTTAYYHQAPFSTVLLVIMTPELNNYANGQALTLREAINMQCLNDVCA